MTDAVITQVASEQWASGSPRAQVTQVAVEEWTAAVGGVVLNTYANVTQVAVEQWLAAAPTGQQSSMVMMLS